MASDNEEKSEIKEQRDRVAGHLDKHGAAIASLCEKISFGLVALPYVLMFGQNDAQVSFFHRWKLVLFVVSVLGALSLLAEFFQHWCAFRAAHNARSNPKFTYDTTSKYFRAAKLLRELKQLFALVGVALFVVPAVISIIEG